MTTLRDLGVSAAISSGITLVCLLAFAFLRIQPFADRVYYPKWYLRGIRRPLEQQTRRLEKVFNLDPKSYVHLLGWIHEAIKMPELELINHAGLDSAVFLRIYLLGLKVFIPIMLMGLLVLVPINATDINLLLSYKNKKLFSSNMDRLSIANVQDGSKRLWAHVIFMYVFTLWTCYLLHHEYKKVAAMRSKYLMTRAMKPDQFTVLVRQFPKDSQGSLDEQVEHFFSENHFEYYLSHQLVYNANKLAKLVKDLDNVENNLNYALLKHSRNDAARPTMKRGFLGLFGPRVDAIDFYRLDAKRLTRQVDAERERIQNESRAILPAAFVSFSTRWGAAVCAQSQQCNDPTLWLTEWAPEPRDVLWENLAIPYTNLYIRKLAVGTAVFLLVFFFAIPVTFIQSLANIEGIERSAERGFGFLKPLLGDNCARSILQGYVPALMLKLVLLFLPWVLMVMSKIEGHLSHSKLHTVSAAKQYYFTVFNVFFVSVLTGTAFQQLDIIKLFLRTPIDIPKRIPGLLGNAIPLKATFFITFIMVDGWSSVALEILRLKALLVYHFKNIMFVKTERDRERAMAPGNASFNIEFPKIELYFFLGSMYSVIAPIVLPFIITYFGFSYIAYRHQVINVYEPEYESAGTFWPHIHNRIVASMVMEQVVLLGLFSTKKFTSSSPLLIALPIITIWLHQYTKRRFQPAFVRYPLQAARARDSIDNLSDVVKLVKHAYVHPVLKGDEERGHF